MIAAFVSADVDRVERLAADWSRAAAPGEVVWRHGPLVCRVTAPAVTLVGDRTFLAGRVRLTDRTHGHGAADHVEQLDLLHSGYERHGIGAATGWEGPMSLIIQDRNAGNIHALRDALGLYPMFYSVSAAGVAISDRPDACQHSGEVDRDFVAAFLATGQPHTGRTIWRGVQPLLPGTRLSWCDGRVTTETFWSPGAVAQDHSLDTATAANEFRRLVRDAVLRDLEPDGRTWSHLSGGHDSSSVTSMAAVCGVEDPARNLGGTVTLVDSIGSGDETRFADSVVRKYGLPNERIVNPSPWSDDGEPPPVPHQPTRDLPYYARDRLVTARIRQRGGTSLLSGVGPDAYLPYTADHAADLFWTGQPGAAVRLVLEWCIARRRPFWRSLGQHVVAPISPAMTQAWLHTRQIATPTWLRADFIEAHGFGSHVALERVNHARPGSIVQSYVARKVSTHGSGLQDWMSGPGIDVRHPLLYRPLVDFCLRLPHRARMEPGAPKPVLRSAMKGIVPDEVLNRHTKGSFLLPRVTRAFALERGRLERLLRQSTLADLGVVEPARLLAGIDEAANGVRSRFATFMYFALALETWFAVRSGRYSQSI